MSFRGGRFRGRRGGGGFDSFRARDPSRKPPTGELYPPLEGEEAKPISLPLSDESKQLVAHQVDFRIAMRSSPYYLTRFDTVRKRTRARSLPAAVVPDRYSMSGEDSAVSEKLDVLRQFVAMVPGLQPDELINPAPYKRHAKLLALKRKIERQGNGGNGKGVDMDKLMEEIEAKEKQRAAGGAAGDDDDDENGGNAGEDADDLLDGIEEDEEDEDNGEDDYNLDNYGSDGDEFDDYRAERDEDTY